MEPEQEYDGAVNSKIHYLFANKKNSQKINKAQKSENSAQKNSSTKNLSTVVKEVKKLKPTIPVYFIRPNSIKRAVKFFIENFQNKKFGNDILYSVKSNPDIEVLKHLFASGIKHFDVASLDEIKLINELFGNAAKMYFMHPIKSREAIFAAYFDYGIRDFSFDSSDELTKILKVTNNAKDLGLHLRLAIPNSHAAIDLSSKFGILPSEATSLIRKARTVAKKFGICFHVGSQCMDPIEYRNALTITKEVLQQAKVAVDVIDIGGGFPSSYPGMTPPDLRCYFDEIFDAINHLGFKDCKIWCEPGRALVAEAGSLLVRVEGKKKAMLYLNDGTYGGLFDAGFPGFIYPTKVVRIKNKEALSTTKIPFGFFGPTCDSLDVMKGPFYLPENISEGDYIEIGQLGAYSRSIRTNFNGFNQNLQIEVADEPLVSMYKEIEEQSDEQKEELALF
ncbi:MAG: type III PLP-dependent enzyme [Rickettsiales bacterium]|nr:type III PLP-dependent enzyme [Rickettsiales bacterium]